MSSTRTSLQPIMGQSIRAAVGQVKITVHEPKNVKQALEDIIRQESVGTRPESNKHE